MKRAIVHALLILGLVGMGWALQLTENHFPGVNWHEGTWERQILERWRWIPQVFGTVALGLTSLACFAVAREKTRGFAALLAVPGLILLLSAIGFHGTTHAMMTDFVGEGFLDGCYQDSNKWFTRRAYFAQTLLTRGVLWAGLAYAAVALAAGCVPTPQRRSKDTLRWAWPAASALAVTVAGGVYVTGYGKVFFRWARMRGQPAWSEWLPNATDLLHVDSLPRLLPLLSAMAILGLLPLGLLALRPRIEELSQPVHRQVAVARTTAAFAVLGAALGLGLATWLAASSDNLQQVHAVTVASGRAADRFATLASWGPHRAALGYLASGPAYVTLILAGMVGAAPLLVTSRRALSRALVPAVLLTAGLLSFAVIRANALAQVQRYLEPRCQQRCMEIDRQAATFTLSPLITNLQTRVESCDADITENDELVLARTPFLTGMNTLSLGVTVRLERRRVVVEGEVLDSHDPAHPLRSDCDSGSLAPLRSHLQSRAEEARAVASRYSANSFVGRLNVVPDAKTPSGTLDCVLRVANESGFEDAKIVVARPRRSGKWTPLRFSLYPDPERHEPVDDGDWTLRASPGEYVLVSPAGATWTSTSRSQLELTARSARTGQPGYPDLWIIRSPDLPLQEDLDLRAAMSGRGLFYAPSSLPLHPQSTTAAIPAQASPTTSP